MKNIFFLVLLSSSINTFAQKGFSLGIDINPNWAYKFGELNTLDDRIARLGLSGGVYGYYSFGKYYLKLGQTWIDRGSRDFYSIIIDGNGTIGGTTKIYEHLYYLGTELSGGINLKQFYIEAGASFNSYLNRRSRIISKSRGQTSTIIYKRDWADTQKFMMSIETSAGYTLHHKALFLKLGVRVSLGLKTYYINWGPDATIGYKF